MGSSSTVKIVGLLTTLLPAAWWPAPGATGDKRLGPLSTRVDAAAIVAPIRRINRLRQGHLAPHLIPAPVGNHPYSARPHRRLVQAPGSAEAGWQLCERVVDSE